MFFKILGVYGSRAKNKNTVCFQISENTLIDAGNILNTVENPTKIKHIILSHPHIDHIQDLPYFIDTVYSDLESPVNIYATEYTLNMIKNHIFNNEIWPEFQNLNIKNSGEKAVNFIKIKPNEKITINGTEILPFSVKHTVESLGFLINKNILISGDTAVCKNLTFHINKFRPEYLFLEVSFPSDMQNIADISAHMTPNDIKKIIKSLSYKPKKIFIYHMKPQYEETIKKELANENIIAAQENMTISDKKISTPKNIYEILFEMIRDLYTEKNINKILNKTVTYAREITDSDAATLYIKTDDDLLEFKIIQNETLNIFMDKNTKWPKLPLYVNGRPNYEMAAAVCALKGEIIKINDAYNTKRFNFEGTKKFDAQNGYRSKSMLVIPLKNHENEIIGVLQLINKYENGKITTYSDKDKDLTYLLSSIAAVSLTKNRLIEDFEKLMSSLIQTIGMAIDEKSKYTSGHVQRVAKLAVKIAKAAEKEKIRTYCDEELKTIEIAGWLHDIGKITTPEYIMNKATKLNLFTDLINYIKYKFELAKTLNEIKYLKKEITRTELENRIKTLDKGFELVKRLNKGKEFTTDEDLEKLKEISQIKINGENLINETEFKNLSVRKGTLTEEERKKIEEHALIGHKMLSSLHFPKKFKNLPAIAANHHEKLNCKGYPKGLCAEKLSLEERIMAIADIFEALSAADRPYKEPKKISEIFKILYFMSKDGDIDKDIIGLMIKHGVYEEYAKEELKKEQIDDIPAEIMEYFLS